MVVRNALAPSATRLLDHDPTKPSLDLTGEAKEAGGKVAVVEEWPSGAKTEARAKALAKRRLLALRAGSATFEIDGSAPQIAAGHVFTLTDTLLDITTKNKKNTPERMELKKFNPILKKVTLHKEIK